MTADACKIDWNRVDKLIEMALEEDLGDVGDTTSMAVIPAKTAAKAILKCKDNCVCAGLSVAERVFKKVDPSLKWRELAQDGEYCQPGKILAEVSGPARSLLTAERTVLNFIQRLSGIATASRKYAEAAATANSHTLILDTRKTIPGWRNLEKYAVAAGGASNHRIGLYDRIMIKDNHRELAGLEGGDGIRRSVERARKAFPSLEVEVEADTLDDVKEALDAGADYILLDNMSNEQMSEAVKMTSGKSKLEASGGITLERIPSIAALGVDFISAGAITHSVKAADISLDILL